MCIEFHVAHWTKEKEKKTESGCILKQEQDSADPINSGKKDTQPRRDSITASLILPEMTKLVHRVGGEIILNGQA